MALIAPETIYTKTAKGILEIRNKTVKLSRELGLVFLAVDGKASVGDLLPHSGMSAAQFNHALNSLVTDGYIKVVSQAGDRLSIPAGEADLDFTSPQAVASVNMEAASRALAAAEAVKRAQQEARAALDARMRQESEARGRAQAEARADAEGEARAKAEEAARAANEERRKAEIEARDATDPVVRAEAEARARAAAAAVVRAQAEARVRGEAEERARALAATKRAAEEEARKEAEMRAGAEQQAQARAAAEGRAHEVLEAQVEAMQGVRAHADKPQAQEADAARARVRELEAEAERAREAARVLAKAEGRADEVPQPEMDIAERVRQLNARVQVSRGSREAAERQSRDALPVEFDTQSVPPKPKDGRPSPAPGEKTPGAQPPQEALPTIEIPPDTARAPAQTAADARVETAAADLPVVDFARVEVDRTVLTHPTPEHVPSALERAMAQMAAPAQARAKSAPEGGSEQAREPVVVEPEPEAQTQAAPAAKVEPTLDNAGPLHERLNIDRAAHDFLAEKVDAQRKAEAAQFNRDAMNVRRQRVEDDARRAAAAERQQRRKRVLWSAGAALVLVPALTVAWLQFTSLNGYIPEAQRALSQRLNQPVTITKLQYVLLPTPRLVLEGVTVGAGPAIRAQRVEARVLPLAALAGPRHFDRVDVHGATIDAAMLATVPAWTGGRSADAVHVDRLRVTEATLNLPGVNLGAIEGNVEFASNGTVKEAAFTSPKAKLELTPRPEGVRFAFDASDSQVPFGPAVAFSQIKINGLVDQAQVAAAEFSGKLAGGSIEGAATARWGGPISVQGEFKLQNTRVQDLVGGLSPNFSAKGSLKATGRFGMQGPEWATVRANPQVDASFVVTRGELTNIDLVRAVQAPSIGAIRGGRTPFDEITGAFQFTGGHYLYRQLQLSSGLMNAAGAIDVGPNGQLNGRLQAEVSSRSGVVARSALLLSGTVQDPQLKR